MRVYFHSFICYCLRNTRYGRNSKRIWPYSSSRSPKVIDLGVYRKRICDFLLVTNSKLTMGVSLTAFKILTFYVENSVFFHSALAWRPLAVERLAISTKSIYRWKVLSMGYNSVADITGLSSFVKPLLAPKFAKSVEIPPKFDLTAVQSHPRSSIWCQWKAHIRLCISH